MDFRKLYFNKMCKEIDNMELTDKEKEHFKGLLEYIDDENFVSIHQLAQHISSKRRWTKMFGKEV